MSNIGHRWHILNRIDEINPNLKIFFCFNALLKNGAELTDFGHFFSLYAARAGAFGLKTKLIILRAHNVPLSMGHLLCI